MTDAALAEVEAIRTRAIAAIEGRPGLRPRDALRRLRAMPKSVWADPSWAEASVLVCAVGRIRPVLARRRLRRLGDDVARGAVPPERLEAVRDLLDRETGSRIISNHGFGVRHFGEMDRDALEAECAAAREALGPIRAIGYDRILANSGTLLGLIREGRLLPHDDDFDFAVLLNATSWIEAAEEWSILRKLLADAGAFAPTGALGLILTGRTARDRSIDVFPAWIERGRLSVYPYADASLDGVVVGEPVLCERSGFDLPARPDVLLESNFGPDWRDPNDSFVFPWSPANRAFAPFAEEVARHG